MSRIDLDAARAARQEARGEGPVVVWNGQELALPAEVPFEVAERYAELSKAQASGDDVSLAGAVTEIVRGLLGPQRYEQFMAGRPSVNDLEELVNGVTKLYGFADVGESQASAAS